MSLKKIKDFTVYKDACFYASFPACVLLPSGEVLITFRRAPDHRWTVTDNDLPSQDDFNSIDHHHSRSHIAMIKLDSNHEPVGDVVMLPADPEASDQDANLITLKSGRILQYGFLYYPILPEFFERLKEQGVAPYRNKYLGLDYLFWGSYVRYSDDEGAHWSDRVMLPLLPEYSGHKISEKAKRGGPLRGRGIVDDNGRVTLSIYFSGFKELKGEQTQLFISDDEGGSWASHGQPIHMPDVNLREPALANWPDANTIIAFHRTKGLEGDFLVTATSNNYGNSFENIKQYDVIGHPYDPLVLSDGRLFLAYGYRHEPYGIRARLVSKDQEINDAKEIIIRDDSVGRDCGYPWSCQLDDERIMVVYYVTHSDGLRGIEASILELEKQ